jgi:hypothetical protein
VLRFTADDVLRNPDRTLAQIRAVLDTVRGQGPPGRARRRAHTNIIWRDDVPTCPVVVGPGRAPAVGPDPDRDRCLA